MMSSGKTPAGSLPDQSFRPRVTVVVPCLNEIQHIAECLSSIVSQDYPVEKMEVLVVDGISQDGTRDAICHFVSIHPHIRLIDNPQKITSVALNLGIAAATGFCVLWMSAHNRYPADYISRCVDALDQWKADNAGGVIVPVPRKKNLFSKAILVAISHPFGVGNSKFRTHSTIPMEVDTVFGGCYRKAIFDKVGFFNEKLVRGQDMELNLRIKRASGKIVLVPSIQSEYFARTDLVGFCRHNWANGKWAILPFKYSDIVPVSVRHIVPLFFVAALLFSVLLMAWSMPWGAWGLVGILVPYGVLSTYYSLVEAITQKSFPLVGFLPVTFFLLHFFYGLGSIVGFLQSVGSINFWRQFLRIRFFNS